MTITFTNIQWRNNNDKDIFNLHELKSISLEGLDSGIVTIKGESGVFKAPYCGLTLVGGVSHFELTTKHPSKIGEYIYIAIFDEKVAIAHCQSDCVYPWFDYKCRTFCCNI